MSENPNKILFVAWGVYPQPAAMAVLIHTLATTLSTRAVVAGEFDFAETKDWSEVNYPLYHLDPFILGQTRGIQYTKLLAMRKITGELETIAKKHDCRAIFCSFPDELYLGASYFASKRLNIPLFTWFHNTYSDNRTGVLGVLANWLQPRVFAHATMNFTMSDGMQRFYEKRYPSNRFQVLRHCFDLPKETAVLPALDRSIIKFAYTGNLNESCADAALRLCKYLLTQPNYELHILGGKSIRSAFEQAGICAAPNVVFHGFVPDADFIKMLQTCHIVLLPHGFDGDRTQVEFETIFPTRTVPLLYCGRPILAHTPKNVFFTDFLEENNCAAVTTTKNERDIQNAIDRLLSDEVYCEDLVNNARKTANLFDKNIIAQQLLNKIDEVI